MGFPERLASRSAAVYADFFLPLLDGESHVLDLGCGDGAISVGLAEVAGRVTAVDVDPRQFADAAAYVAEHHLSRVTFERGSAQRLSFDAGWFDACWCHSLLEAVPDPAAVLDEIRRVLAPGGVVAAASVEYGGLVLAGPHVELLRRSNTVREQFWLRSGSDPFLGRELRRLLAEAGFEDVEATTQAFSYGTPPLVRDFAAGRAEECWDEEYADAVVAAELASADDLRAMAAAWTVWGESPTSYAAFTWCRAVGRAPLEPAAR